MNSHNQNRHEIDLKIEFESIIHHSQFSSMGVENKEIGEYNSSTKNIIQSRVKELISFKS